MSSSGATPSDTVEPLAPVTWLFGEPPIAVAPEELSSPHSTEVAQQHDPVQRGGFDPINNVSMNALARRGMSIAEMRDYLIGRGFDITVLAGFLSVAGYSINDKVVVFDRIREMFRITSKLTPAEVVDRSINTTLSRTIMTALTTALAMLGLFLFGGPSVENFALVMLIGIVVGTLSSIMFAAQLLLLMGVTKRDLMPKARDVSELERRP